MQPKGKQMKTWLRDLSTFIRRAGRVSRGRRNRNAVSKIQSLEQRQLLTINFQFDYRYDSSGFFNPQDRKDTLEAAADVLEDRINDDLNAITPGGSNNWTAVFPNPSNGAQVNLQNLSVAADTIVVFVGARNLSSGLGIGGPGGLSVSGFSNFVENVQTRGESGVDTNGTNDTDFGLWGGTIAFERGANWHFGLSEPPTGQSDFYSVALHELAHVLGFGTSDSFVNKISGTSFTGSRSRAVHGSNPPMYTLSNGAVETGHWAAGLQSPLPGTATLQETAMDPDLNSGTRKLLTNLDWAALEDIGWEVSAVAGPMDYGDAPDGSNGTSTGNYQTRAADNGPVHAIVNSLFIGSSADADTGINANSTASADDETGSDDEGFDGSDSLFAIEGIASTINVNVTNNSGSTATLYGWVDFDRDGNFEANERANASVANGSTNVTVSLNFAASALGTAGSTFARFRLSTDSAAAAPTGPASNGEVEDHPLNVLAEEEAFDPLPLFKWSSISNAVRYELEVTNSQTGELIVFQNELTSTSFRPTESLPVGNYSWRYRGHTASSPLAWSAPVTFGVFESPSNLFITDPVGSSVDSLPTFAWTPLQNATRYELWVNGTQKNTIIRQNTLTTTSFTPTEGLPADTYTAWVRALNGNTEIHGWSSAFSFTLSTTGTSTLTEPVGGSTTTAPTFGWLPMTVPTYELQVDRAASGETVLVAEQLSGTSFTPDTALQPGDYVAYITGAGHSRSAGVPFQIAAAVGQVEFDMGSQDSENPLPTFRWHRVAQATRYELWVEDRATRELVLHDSQLSGTVLAARKALPTGSYRAWVRAFNGSEAIGTWSDALDYTVRNSVAVPSVWAPVDSTQNSSPTFVWSSVFGATHYEVDLLQNAVVVETEQFVASNSTQFARAIAPGTYQTTVRAYDGTTLLGTDTRRFNVRSSSGTIEIFSPTATTNLTRPVYSWAEVDGATRYFLWVNDDSRGIVGTVLQNNLTSPTFQSENTLGVGKYRAWVRAYNGTTPVSDWSSAFSFEVEATDDLRVTSPEHTTSNPVPAITWTIVPGAVNYDVEIDDITNGTNAIVTATSVPDTVFRPTAPLSLGRYQVRVRSVNVAGTASAWSTPFDLTIENAANPTLVRPTVNSLTPAADAHFVWTPAANVARYELWVNNLSTGEARVIDEMNVLTNEFTPATALPAGKYRAWVRAILTNGTEGIWSPGVEFELT